MSIIVRSLPDQAYEIVREHILLGTMAPGTAVQQAAVASQLGISKIPLREALGRLEQDGLVTSFPNRGYVVNTLTAEEATEVFALRLKLEPGATADGARRATPADREHARAELLALEREQGTAGTGHVTHNRAFHMALIRPAGGITSQLMERLHILSERYVRAHLEPQGRDDRARDEHRALFDAWMAGDAAVVETLTARHIQGTLEDLQRELAG
ncbi:GntR family transcriptional regulator [Nitrospirillum amazonense]|uniref:DNA-binding GntR family transcriptional regulator n=1 Tax=Nitrospirillum amazonense TaxID=28077 RepID=A0A560KAR8_9PROT|nr:GntR family transcriptional regulator [Nitrospirillum amazonense]MDG3444167.1 GntR family transcriptional regulator [Nitrospirillum amazonense]TWB77720.1 DNA-binding GntR family transcriptional regulator [Nitrospirillum amazonense]